MSKFVIVHGAWDTPAAMEPLVEPMGSAGHAVVVVDLPCEDADATVEEYADAVRSVLPDDLADVVLVGYSFGGFTASRIAVDHPDLPVVYVAAWIPRDGASVLDPFAGGDPFESGEEAGIAAFDGLILSAGPGLCALNIARYVTAADPSEQDAIRSYLERTQRPQGIVALREKWRGESRTSSPGRASGLCPKGRWAFNSRRRRVTYVPGWARCRDSLKSGGSGVKLSLIAPSQVGALV